MNICLFSRSAIMAKLSLLVFQGRVEGCVSGGGLMRVVHSKVTDIRRDALFFHLNSILYTKAVLKTVTFFYY